MFDVLNLRGRRGVLGAIVLLWGTVSLATLPLHAQSLSPKATPRAPMDALHEAMPLQRADPPDELRARMATRLPAWAAEAYTSTEAMANGGLLSAGSQHTCAVVNGAAKCWGWNGYGQLGDNSTTSSPVPVPVSGLTSGVTAIAAGTCRTCAIVSGGVWCWGYNYDGQLGTGASGSTNSVNIPVQVNGLTSGVTALAVGDATSCAIVNGAARCWGYNGDGQLGNNSTTSSPVPVPVSGLTSGVTAISVGEGHACAVVSGTVKCWGRNTYGQLGNNSNAQSPTPVPVSNLTSGVTSVAVGREFYLRGSERRRLLLGLTTRNGNLAMVGLRTALCPLR